MLASSETDLGSLYGYERKGGLLPPSLDMRLSSFNADGDQIREDFGNHLRAFFLLLRKLMFVVRGIRRLGGVVRFGF